MSLPATKPDRILPAVLIVLFASILLGLTYYGASPVGLQAAQPPVPAPVQRAVKHLPTQGNHPAEGPK